MNLSISSFSPMKHYASLFLAVVCAVIIECILAVLPVNFIHGINSQLLHMAYYKPIRSERTLAAVKFSSVIPQPGELVQIGDSSGLVSVNPAIIDTYLPNQWHYLNASLQVPAQFEGIYAMVEQALKQGNRKFLVGHFAMFHLGSVDEGFGDEIATYYNSPWRYVQLLPSLYYRNAVLNNVYYGGHMPEELDFRQRFITLTDVFNTTHGWIGVDMKNPSPEHDCNVTRFNASLAAERMEKLYALTRHYNARLIMILGPVKCRPDATTKHIEETFAAFQAKYPDVLYPLPVFNRIEEKYLGDEVHVTSKEGADYYSNLLGNALKQAFSQEKH